jgi:hypothetical protein
MRIPARSTNSTSGAIVTAAGAALALGAFLANTGLFWDQINDDAFITWRYSRNLAAGAGPVFNAGERVEGYTNFSLMLLMAAAIKLLGPACVWWLGKAVGVAAGVAALGATAGLAAAWLRLVAAVRDWAGALGWLAAGLVAVSAPFALNSTTGLETSLFAALIATGVWLAARAEQRGRWCGAGIAFALSALTRPEGAAVFAVHAATALAAGAWRPGAARRRWIVDAAIVSVTVTAHVAFRCAMYDGEWLPNTYYAKRGGLASIDAPGYLQTFVLMHLGGVLPVLAAVPLVLADGALRRAVLPGSAVFAFGLLSVFATGPDWMPGFRLLVAYVPIGAALAAVGIALLASRSGLRPVPAALVLVALLPIGMAVWESPARAGYRSHASMRARGYREGHLALARWLNERAAPGDSVALMDIGIVGFECPRLRVLDITGLTDRFIAHSPGPFLDKRFELAYVFDRRPRFLVITLGGPLEPGGGFDPERLVAWTDIEDRLAKRPEFRASYVRPREPAAGADELERTAALFGAAAAFRHAYPGTTYLLLVYERSGP